MVRKQIVLFYQAYQKVTLYVKTLTNKLVLKGMLEVYFGQEKQSDSITNNQNSLVSPWVKSLSL